MAEFEPDKKLRYLARAFVDRVRELDIRTDGTQILDIFTIYMLKYRPGFNIASPLLDMDRRYRYEKFRYDGTTGLLTIRDESGARDIFYLESNSVLFEDLISKPEVLRSSDDLLELVRANDRKKGLAKIRTMRTRVRQTIGDTYHGNDDTWDWIQTVHNGTILMGREKFLKSVYYNS